MGQLAFVLDDLKRRAATEPALAANPMVQAALAGDFANSWKGSITMA